MTTPIPTTADHLNEEEISEAEENKRLNDLLANETPFTATPDVLAKPPATEAPADTAADTPVDAVPTDENDTVAPFPASRRQPKLHPIVQAWSRPVAAIELTRPRECVTLPTVAAERMDEIVADLRNVDLVDSADISAWTKSYEQAGNYYPRLHRWAAAVNNSTSDFRQSIPSAAGELGIRSPRIGDDDGSVSLTGAKAVNYVRARMGLGTVKQIPLWASGFWVSLKAAPEPELLELYRRLSESKIELGRRTGGLVYSNTRAFTTAMLVDFAIEHIFDHTIAEEKVDLASLISSNDIPVLIAGLAATTHPNGFNYRTQCMAAPEECHNVVEQRADITKMVFTDYNQLTEEQIKHMSRSRGRTMSVQSIKDYQAKFRNNGEKLVDMGDGVKLFLKLPTCREYENIGTEWINSIITMVTTALGLEVADGERNAYITKQSNATVLRQYQHFVDHIECGGAMVNTQEGIATLLADFSRSDDSRQLVIGAVGKYIDDNTVSVVATTDFVCPACGRTQNDHSVYDPKITRSAELIPIHVEQVFFTLLAQKDQLVALR